VTGSGCLVFSF